MWEFTGDDDCLKDTWHIREIDTFALYGNKIFCKVGSSRRLINNFYGLANNLLNYYIKDCSKLIESVFDGDEIDELLSVYLYLGDIYNVIVYRENITLSER